MSDVGLEKRGSVCIWMNWTQGHHVSKCAFSVRTHLAVESNFSYVPSGVFQLDFSKHEKQPFYICCKLSKSVVILSLLKIYVFFMSFHLLDMNSASSNPKSCPLWPKRSPPPSSTSTQPLKLANSWSKLSTPSLAPSLRSRDCPPKWLILAFSKFSIFFNQFQTPVLCFCWCQVSGISSEPLQRGTHGDQLAVER